MSSFEMPGGATVTFLAEKDRFQERREKGLRIWDFELHLDSATDFTALDDLVCASVVVRAAWTAGSFVTHVDIAGQGSGVRYPEVENGAVGAAGQGNLTLDGVADSPFLAVLTQLRRPGAWPGGGRRCIATFQELPTS